MMEAVVKVGKSTAASVNGNSGGRTREKSVAWNHGPTRATCNHPARKVLDVNA